MKVFRESGYNVVHSHIDDGKDFFTYEPENWDIMISNPPFSKKDKVLQRAYKLGKPFALLLPVNSIQGKERFEIFKNDVQMLCFDSRIGFMDELHMDAPIEKSPFGSAYFCRNFLPSKLELRKIYKNRTTTAVGRR